MRPLGFPISGYLSPRPDGWLLHKKPGGRVAPGLSKNA